MKKYCVMSIKPIFYNKIVNKEKTVEYRKVAPKDVDVIFLYVSAPVKKILGYIVVDKIFTDKPDEVWLETKEVGGISKDYFFDYVGNKGQVSAIFIKRIVELPQEIILENFYPPQNYLFRTDEEFSNLER